MTMLSVKKRRFSYDESWPLVTASRVPSELESDVLTGLTEKSRRRRYLSENAVIGQAALGQPHCPVLVKEVLSALVREKHHRAIYLDCTVGMGGHSEAILRATSPYGKVIGIDRDDEAIACSRLRLISFQDRIQLIHGSFKNVGEIVRGLGINEVNGLLFDCGVSSMQLSSPQRGFSFAMPGPLDMRMDRRLPKTAADIVNTLQEKALADLIYRYGEEKASRRIAAAIVHYRNHEGPIIRTDCLSELICQVVYPRSKGKRIHPATKTFQALRICVNNELEELQEGIAQAISILAVGGRFAVISFHSMEDRIVKQSFKEIATLPKKQNLAKMNKKVKSEVSPHAEGKRFIYLYKKPITPAAEEIAQNPKARSAKLRVLERVA